MNQQAAKRYEKLKKRGILQERGFEFQEQLFIRDRGYETIRGEIARRQWQRLCAAEHVGEANHNIVCAFFANYPYRGDNNEVYVRGVHVPVTMDVINNSFNLVTLGE